jgi:DNA-binding response OmpR family regulator
MQAGADHVLRKPVSMAVLFDSIGSVLAQRGDSSALRA